jgi:hypothetical protein
VTVDARIVRLALRVVMQNDREVMEAILLYKRLAGLQRRCGMVKKISPPYRFEPLATDS